MEQLYVTTVQSPDYDGAVHTAFTVYNAAAGALRASAGWTLRDAVEFYARAYGVEKGAICFKRPFIPQEKQLRENEERV